MYFHYKNNLYSRKDIFFVGRQLNNFLPEIYVQYYETNYIINNIYSSYIRAYFR